MFANVCIQVDNFSIYIYVSSTWEAKNLFSKSRSIPMLIVYDKQLKIAISTIENHR